MRTILLTSGRGTYALTLARSFHRAGHRVLVADSWPRTFCRFSSAVGMYFHVPSPAQETQQWVQAILRIVDAHSVDMTVPIYEEVLYLTQAFSRLSNPPHLFASDFETLIVLHNKWLFNQQARYLGLRVPKTVLLTSRGDLKRVFRQGVGPDQVFKPVYSRFAAHATVRPLGMNALAGIEPTTRRPWVAQEFLPGRPFATFSVAHRGRITAHTTYATDFCHDVGPTVVYRRADHPAIFEWVKAFIKETSYTGQIGIDFIEDESGDVSAIECNPRLTGGLYLLKDDVRFADAYFNPALKTIEATQSQSYAFRFWLLVTLARHTKDFPGFREWCRQFFLAKSTNESVPWDPLPRWAAPLLASEFFLRCLRDGTTARAAITRDFEWSEEQQAGLSSDFDSARSWAA